MPVRRKITDDDLTDLRGKVAIVTGGNTGIGYATIQFLMRQGAKVYMGARNEDKAKAAIKELEAELPKDTNAANSGGSVHWLQLDLSNPGLVKEAAAGFLRKEERLDILVNNAAATSGPYKPREDGFTETMVVNHISPFLFTETLLPLLKSTAALDDSDVRIVNVTSVYHTRVKVESFVGKYSLSKDYGDTTSGNLYMYGVSKLANILYIKHLQAQLNAESSRITCIAVHPGTVSTDGVKKFFSSVRFFGLFLRMIVMPLIFVSWTQGAMNSVFAAAGKDVAAARESTNEARKRMYEGVYLIPIGKITEPSENAKDKRLQKELYETTKEVLRDIGL
ncbi:NAD-P-binding protein [Lentinula aciculospora]|uniref:NAD-P-binding protein n=1 Tax=Lentinula aciculospora TaxID=153920 RepID=A0A9W9DP64_9AGAR|nr:NAD-P-binding protein [Lentinula aciculospora]